MSDQSITQQAQDRYAAVAKSTLSTEHRGVRAVAEAFGYTPEELAALPAEANMGLSCGNPTATAHLKAGEVVVDLGSGGGIDVLLASQKVGPTGKAIGIDMTPEMIERARAGAVRFGKGTAPANVEFLLGKIDAIPLPDGSADCVISNCVINLAPDKSAVFREMFRVLKPGGRVAVSDVALKKAVPAEVGQDILAYVGCIAGAISIAEYDRLLREAGFQGVQVVDTRKDLNTYSQASGATCCAPSACCAAEEQPLHDQLADLMARYDVNEYAASVQVY